jgi:hypothetical protein
MLPGASEVRPAQARIRQPPLRSRGALNLSGSITASRGYSEFDVDYPTAEVARTVLETLPRQPWEGASGYVAEGGPLVDWIEAVEVRTAGDEQVGEKA